MRPLPRLHAITDAEVIASPGFAARASAIAAAGSAVALHARDRGAGGAALSTLALRLMALARPPEAGVFVNARPDLAAAMGAHGVQLGLNDLAVEDARRIFPGGWIGCSVHTPTEATEAVAAGADFLVLGAVYATPSHPRALPGGLALVREVSALGRPVIAIGGITPARAVEVREAGAYGAAAISALWYAPDPASAALALLDPWMTAS